MTPEQRAALLEVLALEREIEAAAAETLQVWLDPARAAVLPVFTAAAQDEIPPDPNAIAQTGPVWEAELDRRFMPRMAALLDRQLGSAADRLGEWRGRYLASVRARLVDVPANAARRVAAAIRDRAGQAVSVVRELAVKALDYAASWRDDATRIGRTEAIGLFNAARVAAADLEERDTGIPLDKTWLSLHDDRVRDSHRHADRQRVPLAAKFQVGGAYLEFPGDPNGPPDEVIGCRCVVVITPSALEIPAPARVASAADTGGTTMARRFEALLIPTGVVGRSGTTMLAANVELVDTALPLPMKWQRADIPAHDGSVTVGAIEQLEVRDTGVWGIGTMLDNAETAEVEQQIEAGVTQPSAELVARAETLTDAAGNPVTPETAEQLWMDGAPVVMRIDVAEIVGASLVSVPEFRETSITLGDTTEQAPNLSLVAAAQPRIVPPDIYPASYFEDPKLTEPTPIHVTADGRVIGHLACWNAEHRAYPNQQVTPYRSHSGYAEFHQSPVHLDNDEVLRVGRLTVGGGHAVPGRGMRAALEHHDNVSTCWAFVRAGEDDIGIWVSGAIEANAPERMVKLALQTPHSGHWEPVAGHPELILGHAVNAPGFSTPLVQQARNKEGELAMVASCGPAPARPPMPESLLADIARRGAEAYALQQAEAQRQQAAQALVASMSGRRRILADVIREDHARRKVS